jgi:pimeloyl-ACP methyl ester carboxylesterase
VALEHRFYGQSIPNGALSTANYRFLTVQQALADLAHFRDVYQREHMPGSTGGNQWIAVGGSYPGALSAWFRVAYPNATVAALASSGVVLPVYAFHEFDEQVAEAAGEHCADVLRRTTDALELEMARGNGTRVRALFGSRPEMEDADFFYMLADSAAMAVQYGHKNVLCDHMLGATTVGASLVDAFAQFTNDMYGRDFGDKCFYNTKCLTSEPSRWDDDRSWRWQKCSQLAYFQVAPSSGSLRSTIVDLAYHERQCRAIFGDVVNPSEGVKQIVELYGGDHPRDGHRIFFSNGADDPWQRASVVKTLIPDDEVANLAVCNLCGHCGDLGSNPNVPEPLKKQRQEIIAYLAKWLGAEDDKEMASEGVSAATTDEAVELEADGHRSSPLVLVPVVFAFVALVAVLHADLVRDAPAHRYQPIGANHAL